MDKVNLVLLVDDEEICNFINKKIIDQNNFAEEIVSCLSVDESVQLISDAMAEDVSKLPDVIFLDIKMPEKNGWDFLSEYEAMHNNITKKIRIYMLTSSMFEGDLEEARNSDFINGYISKPLKEEDLKNILMKR